MSALESVVVVGASLAGLSAAHALRRNGFAGRLTLVGAETRRPYQRPPLSKQLLSGAFAIERCDLRVDAGLDAHWRLGVAARQLDLGRRELELGDGERIGFDGLVIATGCRARLPRILDGAHDVFTLRTIDDCIAIRRRLDDGVRHVAIVGAGFIGCEVAATIRERGIDATVVDSDDVPMQRVLGMTLGTVALALHRKHGVRMEMGAGVARVETLAAGKRLVLTSGRTIDADIVIVGVGAEPVVDWLAGSGVMLEDGVLCDAACAAVGVEGIVAAGDVARFYNPLFGVAMRNEHWDNAIASGEAAARTLLAARGEAPPYASVPFFWSDQYDTKMQMLGTPLPSDEVQLVEGSLDARRFVAAFVRDGRVAAVFAQNSMHRIAFYKRLIEAGGSLEGLAAPLAGAG